MRHLPAASRKRRCPAQQLIGLNHRLQRRLMTTIAAVAVGVIKADQRRIATAQILAFGINRQIQYAKRPALLNA